MSALSVTLASPVAQAVACEDYMCGHITRSALRPVKRAAFLHAAEREGLGSLARGDEAPETMTVLGLMRDGAACSDVIASLTPQEAAEVLASLPPVTLSPQVLRVMGLVTEGLSYPEIAEEVGCAVETVRSHVKRAMRATATHNVIDAAVVLTTEGHI